ncbi:MAG: hypothetical protein NT031_10115 [Planctomycetota bacterium]|nr:hypothetical protein [Planctomycetota bacterium]
MDPGQISDAELLDYLAGRLDGPGRTRVEAVPPGSPQARRLAELARTWNALGAWQVDVSGMDVRPGVAWLAMAPRRNLLLRIDWGQAGRIAAAWLVAMALGALAGRGVAQRPVEPDHAAALAHVESATPPSDEALANVLQLDILSDAQAGDAMQAVLEGNAQVTEEAGG